MIFDNNLKEENTEKISINTIADMDNATRTYYPSQTDKINQMLFSQVNTPTKIINPEYETKNINYNKESNYLHSNSLKEKHNFSPEKNAFNSIKNLESKKVDEFKFTENAEFQPFKEIDSEINYLKMNLVEDKDKIINQNYHNEKRKNPSNFKKNILVNSLSKSKSSSQIKPNNDELIENNETPKTKIFTPIKKNQTISLISNSYRSNLSLNFGLNSLSLNLVHRGLIIYHSNKKSHFRSRVLKGPPICLRWVSWLVLNNIPVKRSENIVDYYLSKNIDKSLDKQIIKDIDRTFSSLNSNYFNEMMLKNSLYRILKAYAAVDSEIGYCQGLNLITAFLLIVCNYNEKDVFYILISLLSNSYGNNFLIRGFFTEEFPLLKLYVFFFEELFEKYNKKLKEHFDKLDLPLDTWAGRWFQTLFTICLPVEMCQRVWDCMFAYGPYFIFSFTLALLKELEPKLINKEENIEILDFFNNLQTSLASENANLNSNNERINNLNIKLKNAVSAAGNDKNANLPFNKQYFSIENVIKQALKIRFPDKLFLKLKKKYLITHNIEKDFTEEKLILKINNEELENYTREFGIDFKNNINKTMSSNVKNIENPTGNNTPFKKVNADKVKEFNSNRLINNDYNNPTAAYQENNKINDKINKIIDFSYDDFEKEEENENKKVRVNIGEAIKSLSQHNLDLLKDKNDLLIERKIPNNENEIEKMNKLEKNKRLAVNNNDLVISVENLKYSPRFKTTTASSKKLVRVVSPNNKQNKKFFYENAIINTDLNLELDTLSNPKPEDENLDISIFKKNNNDIKLNNNQINLISEKFNAIRNFNLEDFEAKINSESYTINTNTNLNSENFLSDKSPVSNNLELNKRFRNKLNFFSNDQHDDIRKNKTDNAYNLINRNIFIDNKENKISLKTNNNLFSENSNYNLNSEDFYRINTISDIRKNNINYIDGNTDDNQNNNTQNPFGFDYKIQITHDDINKSLLNNNQNKNNFKNNLTLNYKQFNNNNSIKNESSLLNKSNLFNQIKTSNNNISNIFNRECSNSSYILNTNSNLNDTSNYNNISSRPSGNLNFLLTENNTNNNKHETSKSVSDLFSHELLNDKSKNWNIKDKMNLNSSENLNTILKLKPTFVKQTDLFNKNKNELIETTNYMNNSFLTTNNPKNKSVINSNANSSKKCKNDNYLINTSNISSNSKIKNLLDSKNKLKDSQANKNKYSNLKYERTNDGYNYFENAINNYEDIEEQLPIHIDEFSNLETNNIMNRVRNHAFENFKNKNAFDNYTGSKHEKNEIKDAIFKRSKNNPVYVWKKI